MELTECAFENVDPEDRGIGAGNLKLDLPSLPMDSETEGEKWEPWRGWPFWQDELPGMPGTGVQKYHVRRICCQKPLRKCLDTDSPNVAIRAVPLLIVLPAVPPRATRWCRLSRPASTHWRRADTTAD